MPRIVRKLDGSYNVAKPSKIASAKVSALASCSEVKTESRYETKLTTEPVVGDDYRFLNEGETIKKGDEYFSYASLNWQPTSLAGYDVGECGVETYRRRIKTPQVETKAWVPEKGDVVVCAKTLNSAGSRRLVEGYFFRVTRITTICERMYMSLKGRPDELFLPKHFRLPTADERNLYNLEVV
jgi:hypothetical protein